MDILALPTWPSLPATTISLLVLLCQPIATLAFVVVLSYNYKWCKRLRTTYPALWQAAINLHAVLTESCQLLLLVIMPINTAAVIELLLETGQREAIKGEDAAYWIQAFVVLSLAYHYLIIRAVDWVEEWVLLQGEMERRLHQQWQGGPLVITRNVLVSLWRYVGGTRHKRSSPSSKVTTDDDGAGRKKARPFENEAALIRRIQKLRHLDLAGPERVRRAIYQHTTPLPPSAPEPKRVSIQPENAQQRKDLPTPPDSNEAREKKRVQWAPDVIVVSPSGVERRLSLP